MKIKSLLEKIKASNFSKQPAVFLLRQLYRLVLILPFQLIVSAIFYPKMRRVIISEKEPESFCFFVTSVIFSKENKKVSYGGVRSLFTPEERIAQTIHTIDTIRLRVPNAKVVLIEAGLRNDLPESLTGKADQYLYLGNKKLVRWACDSTFKSLGEASMLLHAAQSLNQDADFYFKISGRYFLNEEFNIGDWRKDGFVLYFIHNDYISTRLYGFRKEMLPIWKYAIIKGLPFSLIGYAIENTLAKFIPRKFVHQIGRLGLTGLSATVKDDIIKE